MPYTPPRTMILLRSICAVAMSSACLALLAISLAPTLCLAARAAWWLASFKFSALRRIKADFVSLGVGSLEGGPGGNIELPSLRLFCCCPRLLLPPLPEEGILGGQSALGSAPKKSPWEGGLGVPGAAEDCRVLRLRAT